MLCKNETLDKEFSKHSYNSDLVTYQGCLSKVYSNSLWGLIIGPFLIPAAGALVFLLRQLLFEKGKEVSPPSLAAAYEGGIIGHCQRFWRNNYNYKFIYKYKIIFIYKHNFIFI